jgi:hypothetical protein
VNFTDLIFHSCNSVFNNFRVIILLCSAFSFDKILKSEIILRYLPGWLKAILPSSAKQLQEHVNSILLSFPIQLIYPQAWDAYPNCKTVLWCPFLGERCGYIIESRHFEGDLAKQENVHGLSEEKLQSREVEILDIAVDKLADKKFDVEHEDPAVVEVKQTNGHLTPGWQERMNPVVCAYKLVTVKFNYFGIGGKVEKYMMNSEREIFLRFHRLMFVWMDSWYNMTTEELDEFEKKMWDESNNKISQAEKTKEESEQSKSSEK